MENNKQKPENVNVVSDILPLHTSLLSACHHNTYIQMSHTSPNSPTQVGAKGKWRLQVCVCVYVGDENINI